MTAGQGFGIGRQRPEVPEDLTARGRLGGDERPVRLPGAEDAPPSVSATGPERPAHDIRPQKTAPPPRRVVAPRPR
jgi:hypothetical protein